MNLKVSRYNQLKNCMSTHKGRSPAESLESMGTVNYKLQPTAVRAGKERSTILALRLVL